jgi:gluconolactonase
MPVASPKVETLVTGYGLIEGPRVDPGGHLYFSDVVRGGVFRRSPDGQIETVVPKRRGVGGIALHEAGGVVVSGRNVCHVREGETRVLFAPPDVPAFNDLFTDAAGRVLVGSIRFDPFSADGPRDPGELYRIEAEGRGTLLYDDVGMANGIGLSGDGRLLFHNDSARGEVLVHDVDGGGACHTRRVFARTERGAPDGLAVDEAGGVWIAAHGGGCATRFTAAGELDRHIDVPARIVTSLCLGGEDRRDLYVVSADNTDDASLGGSIFRTRVDVPGLPVELARI